MLRDRPRIVLAGALVALLLGGPAPASHAQPARAVFVINDPLSEYAIGKRDFDAESNPQSGRRGYVPLSDNKPWQDLVERVGRRLAAVVSADTDVSEWTFVVRKSKGVNAHAHPGGFVCVNEGLLAWLADPRTKQVDEGRLAAVLAHEIAHVARQHFSNALKQAVALREYLRLTDKEKEEKSRVALVAAFSRANEIEADQYGALYLVRAGYRFTDALHVWKTMIQQFGDEVDHYHDVSADAPAAAGASHPGNVERLKALESYEKAVLRPALERFNLGEELLRNNADPYLAVELFRGLKQEFPTSVEVRNNLGVALHKLYLSERLPAELAGQPDLAAYLPRELAERIRPQTRSRLDQRLLKQSIEEYRSALAAAALPQTMSNLAWALLETGDKARRDDVERLLGRAVELAAADPFVLNARGMLEQKRGNMEHAVAYYAKAAEGAPGGQDDALRSRAARYNLGMALLAVGKAPQAVAALRAYLQDDPWSVWGEHVRARLVALGEKLPPKPGLPAIREFAGIALGAGKEKVTERFGSPGRRIPAGADTERWQYPETGLEFLIVYDMVQRIMQMRSAGGEAPGLVLERKVLGIGLDDPMSKIEAALGKGRLRKQAGAPASVEWLTYETHGVEFAMSEGRVFAFMVHRR